MNYDLIPQTIFILNGKCTIRKNNNGDLNYIDSVKPVESIACFEVESWSVLGSLKRDQYKYLSESSLTVADYLSAQEIAVD